MSKTRQRIPKLRFTTWRSLGRHVCYRDREAGSPRKHLFNIRDREREPEARILYHAWVLEHLGGNGDGKFPTKAKLPTRQRKTGEVLSGSLLEITSGLIESERSRARSGQEPHGTVRSAIETTAWWRLAPPVLHSPQVSARPSRRAAG